MKNRCSYRHKPYTKRISQLYTLLIFFLLSCFGQIVHAQASLFTDWELTGFGTLGYAESGKYDDLILKRNITQRSQKIEDHGWLVDSVLGLQVRKELDAHFDIVGQIVAKERANNSFDNSIEMAFFRYQSDERWSFQFGRMVLDTFLLSDHRDVGYSYHSVRPQTEFYGWIPYSNYDGLKVGFEFGDFDSSVRLEAFVGKTKATVNIGYNDNQTSNNYVKSAPIMGGGVTWQVDDFMLRAYIARFRFTQNTEAINALFAYVEPIKGFWPEAVQIAEDFSIEDAEVTYGSIGFEWTPGPWFFQGEFSDVSGDYFGSYDGQRAYLQVGHRIGDFLPYITYSYSWDQRDFPYDPPAPVSPALDPTLQALYAVLKDNLSSGLVDQQSISLGVRWDLASRKALKLQCDYATIGDNSLGIYPTPDTPEVGARNWQKDSRTWCSATFDWVF